MPLETSIDADFPALRKLSGYPSVGVQGRVQVKFTSTDFKKLHGLSTYRDGGGIHIDFCMAPTMPPTASPSQSPTLSPTSMPTPRPTLECSADSDCDGEMRCNLYNHCIKPVCEVKDRDRNYGKLSNGRERWVKIVDMNKKSCEAQVGMQRDDGSTVVYAAFGKGGRCHTYLDYFTHAPTARHGDKIMGAWGLCEEIYGSRHCDEEHPTKELYTVPFSGSP